MAGREEKPVIEIRDLREHTEFVDAVALQKEIWGFEDIELLPVRLFVVATKVGGQSFGAYHNGRMIAFLLAIPGLKPGGHYYLHSHMLGVLPEYRDCGVGRRMKLRQREDALERGIELIEWTFDPLETRNAFFNIERLGAIVRRYLPNQYGTTSSHLHGGLPTDRLVAEWCVGSEHARAIVEGVERHRGPVETRIAVPAEIAMLRTGDPTRAKDIQTRVREQFQENFAKGLAVTGFEKTPESGVYLLRKWESS